MNCVGMRLGAEKSLARAMCFSETRHRPTVAGGSGLWDVGRGTRSRFPGYRLLLFTAVTPCCCGWQCVHVDGGPEIHRLRCLGRRSILWDLVLGSPRLWSARQSAGVQAGKSSAVALTVFSGGCDELGDGERAVDQRALTERLDRALS